jgi:hypothetical protein
MIPESKMDGIKKTSWEQNIVVIDARRRLIRREDDMRSYFLLQTDIS